MDNSAVISLIYQELLKVVGGATIIIAGLSAFLGKVWATRIANQETKQREADIAGLRSLLDRQANELKAKLDIAVHRTVLVDKMQFEHEYEIYRKAWEKLFVLQDATLKLRPMLDFVDPNENKEKLMIKKIKDMVEPFNEYSSIIETNKPFYPETIYRALVAVRIKCNEELLEFEFTDQPDREYWKDARKNQEEILALINSACEAIRSRIAEVRVA